LRYTIAAIVVQCLFPVGKTLMDVADLSHALVGHMTTSAAAGWRWPARGATRLALYIPHKLIKFCHALQ
jgi:hypothetical protein